MVFLGIDAGTTSLKAALFDDAGRMLSVSRQEYSLSTPQPAWVELDPEIYWQACCRAARHALQSAGVPPVSVASCCVSSQGETIILVDRRGRPVRPAIVWLDNRAANEAQAIAQQFDPQTLYRVTGQPEVAPGWPACKLLWLQRHEPELFESTHKILLLEDYLIYRLTGQYVTENALQTSSLLLDINLKDWWQPMFTFLGLEPGRFGQLLHPGDPVGPLSPAGAQALGLSPSTLAVAGGMDQVLGALGAGNLQPGIVSESTGGALGIVASLGKPAFDPLRRIPCHCHANPSAYCLLPWGQTAGMALRWFRDQFYPLETQTALRAGLDPYDQMTAAAALAPPGSEGLLTLPHLEGAACPEFNPHARGVFFGADLRHTRAHFVRSILESVAFMLRNNLEIVASLGVEITEIRSMGGGARSPLWLQIKADVLQKPIVRLETEETALLGAAMLGAVAVGAYPDLPAAAAGMVKTGDAIFPNPALAEVYNQAYRGYIELYTRLEPMFKQPGTSR